MASTTSRVVGVFPEERAHLVTITSCAAEWLVPPDPEVGPSIIGIKLLLTEGVTLSPDRTTVAQRQLWSAAVKVETDSDDGKATVTLPLSDAGVEGLRLALDAYEATKRAIANGTTDLTAP